ncbi:MAG: hypothetical protein IKF17_04100 [Clostridia bacterium]|nr:hypothetical protein [Clostridia bacterium]
MIKEKIGGLIEKEKETNNKKKIESLVVFVIVLVITIIAINSIWNNDKEPSNGATNTTNKKLANSSNVVNSNETYNSNNLEESLEAILSSMNGVGKSKVFINYSESSTVEAMYNETTKESSTEETDTSGGVRTIQQTDTQKDVIYSEESGNKTPVTQKVTNPTIEGAIITAEGANNSDVKANIISAVSAATGLAPHKIQVFKMNNTY